MEDAVEDREDREMILAGRDEMDIDSFLSASVSWNAGFV